METKLKKTIRCSFDTEVDTRTPRHIVQCPHRKYGGATESNAKRVRYDTSISRKLDFSTNVQVKIGSRHEETTNWNYYGSFSLKH